VEELVVVGHSMGGLVARSACHYGENEGRAWTDAVRHVFCLGSPHLGADLEKGANALAWVLARLPETRALASVLNARSAGIKDLRFGSCAEEDWCDCDPDEFLQDRCQEVPFLPDANYYFIAATLSRGALGTLLGDLLVRVPSASGRGKGAGRRIPFEIDYGHELSGLTHFDLLNHPAVYGQLRDWVTGRRAAALGACGTAPAGGGVEIEDDHPSSDARPQIP
jgi:pimeloyl-ACP methyl ester carboxylesterase